jgi:hypothetical protein
VFVKQRTFHSSEAADQLEQLADEASGKSKEQPEQHLEDFPDSPLGQES